MALGTFAPGSENEPKASIVIVLPAWREPAEIVAVESSRVDVPFVDQAIMELEGAEDYGVLYQRHTLSETGEIRYVAFVDCRGRKAQRAYFTRWHEIAHCITTFEQFELPFKRVNGQEILKEPLEKLMDMIAGELGFFPSLFQPVLDREIGGNRITFGGIENVRTSFCPNASSYATLIACASRVAYPVVVIEAGLAHKKAERLNARATPSLRVLRSMSNTAARSAGMLIHRQWRVPVDSVIARVHAAPVGGMAAGVAEDLSNWTSSDGSCLGDFHVYVEAKTFGDRVLAIISHADVL